MSVGGIIKDLPKLRPDERAAVATCLRDIEEQECVEVCNAAAVKGDQLLDTMEQEVKSVGGRSKGDLLREQNETGQSENFPSMSGQRF